MSLDQVKLWRVRKELSPFPKGSLPWNATIMILILRAQSSDDNGRGGMRTHTLGVLNSSAQSEHPVGSWSKPPGARRLRTGFEHQSQTPIPNAAGAQRRPSPTEGEPRFSGDGGHSSSPCGETILTHTTSSTNLKRQSQTRPARSAGQARQRGNRVSPGTAVTPRAPAGR